MTKIQEYKERISKAVAVADYASLGYIRECLEGDEEVSSEEFVIIYDLIDKEFTK